MKARILSYRRGRHTEHTDQFVVSVEGISAKEDAKKLIGKKIQWETPGKKIMRGKIRKVHGNNGAVIAKFERGLPGQALGTEAVVE